MGMQTVVMLKPDWQFRQDGFCIGQISKGDVVSLKGFDKAFGHAVGLRAFDGRGHGFEIQFFGMVAHFFVRVARAVIGQKLNLSWCGKRTAKAALNGSDQQVLDQYPINAFGGSHPADGLSVTTILNKRNADLFAIPTLDLKAIGA